MRGLRRLVRGLEVEEKGGHFRVSMSVGDPELSVNSDPVPDCKFNNYP
jgi:hypothetical protein